MREAAQLALQTSMKARVSLCMCGEYCHCEHNTRCSNNSKRNEPTPNPQLIHKGWLLFCAYVIEVICITKDLFVVRYHFKTKKATRNCLARHIQARRIHCLRPIIHVKKVCNTFFA